MTARSCSRPIVALAAGYALALQAILLAFGALPAGVGALAAVPICAAPGAGHSLPTGHDPGCLVGCLAGCCGASPLIPTAAMLTAEASVAARPLGVVGEMPPVCYHHAARAHRSRAPPLLV